MEFQRHFHTRTLAFVRFRQHHTELNNSYWAYDPAAKFALSNAKKSTASPAQAFAYSGETFHVANTLDSWRAHFREFDNWTRLSALVSLLSYLEVYVRSATSLALESDPGLLLGKSRAIDGVHLLKRRPAYSYIVETNSCVKGDWPTRLSSYRKLFGSEPQIAADEIATLDQMRLLRNRVGHQFGRDGDFAALRDKSTAPSARLSIDRLKSFMKTAMDVAQAIDNHLGPLIGQYEALLFYHRTRRHPLGDIPAQTRRLAKDFGAALGLMLKTTAGVAYWRGLVDHYRDA